MSGYSHRQDKPGRLGQHPVYAQTSNVGTTTLTANTTTDFYITAVPNRAAWIERISFGCSTVAVDSDGTTTAIVSKLRNGTDATALCSAFSVEGLTALVQSNATLVSTLTPAQRRHKAGDVYRVRVTNSSAAIDTQPIDLNCTVELALID